MGYGGYRALAERGDVELAFCCSHISGASLSFLPRGAGADRPEALERIASPYAAETEIVATAAAPDRDAVLTVGMRWTEADREAMREFRARYTGGALMVEDLIEMTSDVPRTTESSEEWP